MQLRQSREDFAGRKVFDDVGINFVPKVQTFEAGTDLGSSLDQSGDVISTLELESPKMFATLLEEGLGSLGRVGSAVEADLPVEFGRLRHLVEHFADLKKI